MNKTLELLKTPFESSSQRTPEWMSFARTFRNERTTGFIIGA